MSPESSDVVAASLSKGGDLDKDQERCLAAVAELGPGDLVYAKYARNPFWPPTIAACDEPGKHRNEFRAVHRDARLTKYWVAFYGMDIPGAWVAAAKIVPFAPELALRRKFQVKEKCHVYQGHKAAVRVATDDYYVVHADLDPGPAAGVDGFGEAGDGGGAVEKADGEGGEASARPGSAAGVEKFKTKAKRRELEGATEPSGRPVKREKSSSERPQVDGGSLPLKDAGGVVLPVGEPLQGARGDSSIVGGDV